MLKRLLEKKKNKYLNKILYLNRYFRYQKNLLGCYHFFIYKRGVVEGGLDMCPGAKPPMHTLGRL